LTSQTSLSVIPEIWWCDLFTTSCHLVTQLVCHFILFNNQLICCCLSFLLWWCSSFATSSHLILWPISCFLSFNGMTCLPYFLFFNNVTHLLRLLLCNSATYLPLSLVWQCISFLLPLIWQCDSLAAFSYWWCDSFATSSHLIMYFIYPASSHWQSCDSFATSSQIDKCDLFAASCHLTTWLIYCFLSFNKVIHFLLLSFENVCPSSSHLTM